MSVQAAVAFLNSNNVDNKAGTPASLPKPQLTNSKTTLSAAQELKKIKTAGGGVATMLNKFNQQPAQAPIQSTNKRALPTTIPTTTTTTAAKTKPSTTNTTATTTATTTTASASASVSANSSSASSSTCSSTPTTCASSTSSSPDGRRRLSASTPKERSNESPIAKPNAAPFTKPSSPERTPKKVNPQKKSDLDLMAEELVSIYQKSLDQAANAENRIKKLEADVERLSSDATKARDYEIRVEYLAQKLEQVSEQRDDMEQKLQSYRQRMVTPESVNSANYPVSSHYQASVENRFDAGPPPGLLPTSASAADNDEYLSGILDAYDHDSDLDEDQANLSPAEDAGNITQREQQYRQQIEFLTQQLRACDQSVKLTVEKYVGELEVQRLHTKRLMDVVRKQDELIAKLESQMGAGGSQLTISTAPDQGFRGNHDLSKESFQEHDSLLKDEVELQRIELENKRELLTQLLNEREDLLRKVAQHEDASSLSISRQARSASIRSSIDVLAEFAKGPVATTDKTGSPASPPYHARPRSGRGTPPPTAPPRDPLPPVPANGAYSTKSSVRGSYSSSHTSVASSTTSWSSHDYESHVPSPLNEKYTVATDSRLTSPRHTMLNDPSLVVPSTRTSSTIHTMAPTTSTPAKKHSSFWKSWKKKSLTSS
ncbi:uncharacterized protein BYT42DRAFT_549626 [Radiomyces spectabilis]|uniref:uncharacterized protein n=1 Tax=Radiomyces spectabilis TaxID=64574 RepID=UPI00222123AC|nr:uncharacterized protein BYT42DRAFT_549626 [Radiomyces spectabilis]KAI8367606.1 hypothetical protein BYT42DRAFT_549626 [Radiomyces spectabilis]